jgi:hypothetical protein
MGEEYAPRWRMTWSSCSARSCAPSLEGTPPDGAALDAAVVAWEAVAAGAG